MKNKVIKVWSKIGEGWWEVSLKKPRYKFSARKAWLLVGLMSAVSTAVFYKLDYIVAYNDARAHMNMARLVIDNLKPGLAQIGSVWLPLNHILTLTLVWNDWLWKTGLAGTVFSMIAYVSAVGFVFGLLRETVKDKWASLLGATVFATNLNILYMQATPMTELLLILFFVATTYFLRRWVVKQKLNDLLMAALAVLLATLTRYDGWFLFMVAVGLIGLVSIRRIRDGGKSVKTKLTAFYRRRSEVEGKVILFATLAGYGIGLWFLWNWVIFNDPWYFAYGPYSAHAQQVKIDQAGSLPTKHNLALSVMAFWWAVVNNAGFLVLIFALVGLAIYVTRKKLSLEGLAMYTLLVPLVFHIVSLYWGHSILILPELGVNVTQEARGSWFNVRYGLVMLPAVAYFAGYLASKGVVEKVILVGLIIIQPLIFWQTKNIITITDGTQGTSSLNVADARDWLVENAGEDDGLILTSISFNNALAFSTGFKLKRFIHEGTGRYWETSLADPSVYAKWIVMANGDVGDPVYDALIKEGNSNFLKRYRLRARLEHLNVYELRNVPSDFVYAEGREFYVNGARFRFVGVNSYDLIYSTPEQISETMSAAKSVGIEVIRFWAFGDGFDEGVQPEPGVFNEERLRMLDYVLAAAKQNDIRVIITLGNYWSDYGGIAQYLEWAKLPSDTALELDKFYTSAITRGMYREYVATMVSRKNRITGVKYKDDPVILAWELMNEPRSGRYTSGRALVNWMGEMSSEIRKTDSSHMIFTGHEGFVTELKSTTIHTGPLLMEVAGLEDVDAVTAHYYLHNAGGVDGQYRHPDVSTWKQYADLANKPLVIEEIGFSKESKANNGVSRLVLYKSFLEEAGGHGVQGVMFWNWALKIDDSFGISPKDSRDLGLIELINNYSESLEE